jgi:hypothetical protein
MGEVALSPEPVNRVQTKNYNLHGVERSVMFLNTRRFLTGNPRDAARLHNTL